MKNTNMDRKDAIHIILTGFTPDVHCNYVYICLRGVTLSVKRVSIEMEDLFSWIVETIDFDLQPKSVRIITKKDMLNFIILVFEMLI